MKIETGSVYNRYQAYASSRGTTGTAAEKAAGPGKMDTISISGDAQQKSEFGRQLQKITSEIETSVSSSKLQSLQERIERDEYHVSTQDLARAMLGFPRI